MKSRIVRCSIILLLVTAMLAAFTDDRFLFAQRFIASASEDSVAASMSADTSGAGRLLVNDRSGKAALLVEDGRVHFAEADAVRAAADKIKAMDAQIASLTARLNVLEAAQSGAAAPASAATPTTAQPPAAPSTPPASAAPQVKPAAKPLVAQVYRDDDFTITLVDARVGPVEVVGAAPSKDDGLVVTLIVENRSKTWKMPYTRWHGILSRPRTAKLVDNLENDYKPFSRYDVIKGGVPEDRSVYPGETMTEVLAFERPVLGAKEMALILPLAPIGGEGEAVFRFKLP
jgi:hypothetical protein